MFFTMTISFYTSRVVLKTLGIEDYGIYNVVGGVVSFFDFIKASMAGSTSRFFSFALGENNELKSNITYSTAMGIHIAYAFLFVLVATPICMWFLQNHMQIPTNRMLAAKYILLFSVISMALNVILVPYNACIISHEKFSIYAYIEIANATLKLVIVYILKFANTDKLTLYGLLIFSSTVTTLLAYRLYCLRNFSECHFKFVFKKEIAKKMLSYSGWDLYGNISHAMRTQGVNILLNLFFGPIANAAAAIATQVYGAIMAFAQNIITAIRPQIIKSYASQERQRAVSLIYDGVKLNFILLLLISIPLISEIKFILHLWLGVVPYHTVEFCTLTLIFVILASASSIIMIGIHATGYIKRSSFINGTLYIMVVPFSYLAFKNGGNPWVAYLFNIIAIAIGFAFNSYTLKLYLTEFSFTQFLKSAVMPYIILIVFFFITANPLLKMFDEGWTRLIITCFISSIYILAFCFIFVIPTHLRVNIINKIKTNIWKTN